MSNALELAAIFDDELKWQTTPISRTEVAAELRRLHEQNAQMLGALIDIAYGLESARIWGGMDWTYNPLHPYKYLPLRDKAHAAIAAERKK